MRESLWVPRYVVAFPALALFLALGIYAAFILIWPQSKRVYWRYIALAVFTILIGMAQTVYYFHDHVPYYMQQFQIDEDWNDAFFRSLDLPPGTHVHFIMKAPVWNLNMTAFVDYYRLKIKMDAIRPDELTPAYIKKITRDPTVNNAFFVNPASTELLDQLRRYFLLSTPQISHEIPLRDQLWLYYALPTLQ